MILNLKNWSPLANETDNCWATALGTEPSEASLADMLRYCFSPFLSHDLGASASGSEFIHFPFRHELYKTISESINNPTRVPSTGKYLGKATGEDWYRTASP